MREASSHPNVETLKAYGAGQIVGTAARKIGQHLETCADCRRAAADATVIARVAETGDDVAAQREEMRQKASGIVELNGSDQFRRLATLPPPVAEKMAGSVPEPAGTAAIP